jgi:hypothetical protein
VPTKPSAPKTAEYAVLALILGFVLGIGLALALRFFQESSPSSPQHLARGNGKGPSDQGGRDTTHVDSSTLVSPSSADHVPVQVSSSESNY